MMFPLGANEALTGTVAVGVVAQPRKLNSKREGPDAANVAGPLPYV